MKKIQNNTASGELKILFVACICLAMGTILGSIGANTMNQDQLAEINSYIGGIFTEFSGGNIETSIMQGMIKYGKYVLLIWCCGFLSPGAIFILLILVFKGISYGFTTSLLVKQYGAKGILLAAESYLPQNLILIPVLLLVSYFSLSFILNRYRVLPPKARLKREQDKSLIEYIIVLIVSTLLLLLSCAIEVYLVPILINFS